MMNKILITLLVLMSLLACENAEKPSGFRLLYTKPAEIWTEALPIGNGRMGAMVYGGVQQEHIQFNEETLWTGEPHDYSHKGASNYLAEIRQLLADGKQREAQNLASEKFMSVPLHQKAYQPFGDLYLQFPGHENYTAYQRELDIEKALAKTSYIVDGVQYKREVFASFPNQVIAVNLSADKKKALNFELALDAVHEQKAVFTEGNTMELKVNVKDGALYGVATLVVKTDGAFAAVDNNIQIKDASEATIYLSAATNYVNFNDVSADAKKLAGEKLKHLEGKKYKELKADHIADYQQLYNRFKIDFGDNGRAAMTTEKRIVEFERLPEDPQLLALYVQYARYLTIAGSREGTRPTTLQGIWNDKIRPPWESKYTVNINTEMNYWPVELTNLPECHEPLFTMLKEVAETGAIVAREHYNCDGWVLHHNTDIWRGAAPINASNHGIWVTGGAWLSTHFWEHYLFTQDKKFLEENYELIKGSAQFFAQFLYRDPNTGYLISSPSNSPEIGGLVAGPTMDHQIIRALFRICIEASEKLNKDHAFAEELKALIPQIAPNQIGQYGQLQEWLEDKDNPEVKHRHVSHLWAVYPGSEINPEETPELMNAAQQSLEFRGDGGTGWSLAWKINYWARFLDGNHAYKMIHRLLSPAITPDNKERGGSYVNLFDAHPPFQIDGNFGGASGIIELLLQSHLGKIELLPALPSALPNGNISGVCARGGFELAFSWKDGQLEKVEVLSKAGNTCHLKYNDTLIEFETEKGKNYSFNGELK
ncbi:glycoside hydrolase family 95 protein [uncultured Draconibacterium sp.]|uniref:glycoside hydrolase family 95 protein n=1 Tax=uncultured Draconibacterium sp. TaxID=1573823 RepID=UPI0025D907BE|nr:glycoside hydrolase family 95 protein [uncultured Draconibacterium sp.]